MANRESEQPELTPAEGRGYRELYATSRQLLTRWRRLSGAVSDTAVAPALEAGSAKVDELLEALKPQTASYDLYGEPAAQGLGTQLGGVRAAIVDRSVDTGVAVRLAVLDIEHLTTLLAYLATLAEARADGKLAAFCRRWEKELRGEVKAVRKAAVGLGADPERAAERLDSSPLGRVAHGTGWALGTAGEWFDRRAATVRGLLAKRKRERS